MKTFRICEDLCAKKILKACKIFDDDTCRKFIYLKTSNDVYAADIHYHKACMSGYLLKFKREVETILNGDTPEDEDEIIQIFREVISRFNLKKKSTHLSTISDKMNELIEKTKHEFRKQLIFAFVYNYDYFTVHSL